MKKLKLSICLLIILLAVGACMGCGAATEKNDGSTSSFGQKKDNRITYKYKETQIMSPLKLKKSVYSENELKLYIDGIDDSYTLYCFDKDFNAIEDDFTTSYKKGVYTISGSETSRISGVYLWGNVFRFYIRYLDSEQYAILMETDATEIGWEMSGDINKYYSQAELDAKQTAKEEYEEKQRATFEQFKGLWVCDEEPELYILFTDEGGNQKIAWNYLDSNGDSVDKEANVDEINIIEGYFGKELEILDGIDWGCRYQYDLSDDLSMIIDRGLDEELYYHKTGEARD